MTVKPYMSQAKFAELCQISGPMVSKYARQGRVIVRRGRVDVENSLAQLEGSLDEEKRQAALKAFAEAEVERPSLFSDRGDEPGPALTASANDAKAPAFPEKPPEPTGWKARGDMFKALDAELAYHERVGNLIPADEMAAAIEVLIANFWTEADQALKIDAAEIASALGLNADQASTLKAMMIRQNRRLRENYAKACRRAADEVWAPRAQAAVNS